MKKLLSLLLALLTVLLCTACTAESMKQADNSEVYRENVVDFTLFIPENWILDTTSFVVSAHVSDSDPSGITMTQAAADILTALVSVPFCLWFFRKLLNKKEALS